MDTNLVSNKVCLDYSHHSDDGAMAFQRLRSICDQTQGERDSLRAECEAMRAALEEAAELVDLLGKNCSDRVWDGEKGNPVTGNKARAALSQGGRK